MCWNSSDEAVATQTMAPMQAHVTAFIEMWCSNPAAREGELHTPPYRTPPNEETPRRIHAQLGDLNDNELQQLIRDLSAGDCTVRINGTPQLSPSLRMGMPVGQQCPRGR